MEKQELLFIGFKSFKSKNEKQCCILSFLTKPINSKMGCYCKPVDIFVTQQEYDSFLHENDIMSWVEVSFEIVGDKVRFKI